MIKINIASIVPSYVFFFLDISIVFLLCLGNFVFISFCVFISALMFSPRIFCCLHPFPSFVFRSYLHFGNTIFLLIQSLLLSNVLFDSPCLLLSLCPFCNFFQPYSIIFLFSVDVLSPSIVIHTINARRK